MEVRGLDPHARPQPHPHSLPQFRSPRATTGPLHAPPDFSTCCLASTRARRPASTHARTTRPSPPWCWRPRCLLVAHHPASSVPPAPPSGVLGAVYPQAASLVPPIPSRPSRPRFLCPPDWSSLPMTRCLPPPLRNLLE
jgi:hypothetical protein